jgi:hypothetical protein
VGNRGDAIESNYRRTRIRDRTGGVPVIRWLKRLFGRSKPKNPPLCAWQLSNRRGGICPPGSGCGHVWADYLRPERCPYAPKTAK